MKTNLVYATSNPGKIIEIGRHFGFHDLAVSKLSDFTDVILEPEETGATLGENALIKANAYAEALSKIPTISGEQFIVIADDTGIFIEGLNGEPGIRVRRWKGYKMTDEEIISHTLERMKNLSGESRKAIFRSVLCVVQVDEKGTMKELITVEGSLKGQILEKDDPRRIIGFPFESLFFVDEYNMLLGDLHRLSDGEKRRGLFNHRERAIEKIIPIIKSLVGKTHNV
jgi:XTP/dITP diphosphohydrolase